MSWIEPAPLADEWIRLDHSDLADAEELAQIAELEFFRYFLTVEPPAISPAHMAEVIATLREMPQVIPFTVRTADGRAVGMTSFLDIRPAHRCVEIGYTWYAREAQGTFVNPAAKRLLLTYAFDDRDAVRVQLKCDARNERSRAAILKLGARFEGILRRHGIQAGGHVRDTAMYSILNEEWPEVRQKLNQRLAAFSPRTVA
jgi:RimJ/RimL family protein N-acetyltransferase